jgi:2-iminoacetate synthase ThiH
VALENAIREAGRIPMQRDSYYRHVSADRNVAAAPEPELVCV